MLKQFWEVKHLWGMPPKNSGGSTKFPGGHKVIHKTAQTAFVRVVTPREVQSNGWSETKMARLKGKLHVLETQISIL